MLVTRILCPTDFSEPAAHALGYAIDEARRTEAQLHLLHVVESTTASMGFAPQSAPELREVARSQRERASAQLKALVQDLRLTALPVTTAVMVGHAADAIVAYATAQQIDLIVMATHGLRGWRRLVFGSVAEVVVRRSPCPVLVVPAPRAEAGAEAAV